MELKQSVMFVNGKEKLAVLYDVRDAIQGGVFEEHTKTFAEDLGNPDLAEKIGHVIRYAPEYIGINATWNEEVQDFEVTVKESVLNELRRQGANGEQRS